MKKVITCLGCRADVCFLRSLLFVRNQLHTENTYTHTHSTISHFFLFLFTSIFLVHFVCLSLFFLLLFYLILFAGPGGACTYTLYTPYERTHRRTHALIPKHHRHNAQCTCMLHYIRSYYFQQIHNIIVVDDRALAAVIAAATVCRCNPQHSRMVYCNL